MGDQEQSSLASLSMIDLSQNPISSTPFEGPIWKDTNGKHPDVNLAGLNHTDINRIGGERTTSNYNRLVPRPTEEPREVCQLSGNSISCFTELCGWSSLLPLKFYNINPTTHLRAMTDGRGDVIQQAEEQMSLVLTLREVAHLAGSSKMVNCPVFVHVVAKRKVDVVSVKNQLLIIPQVVIADDTGYCVLCSLNEGLATIYNAVDVGDRLLLSRVISQNLRKTYHSGLFVDSMFLNLELKLQFHSVRNHYVWKFSPLQVSQFKMPDNLFGSNCYLKVPSELEKDLSQLPVPLPPPSPEEYYDLIGVVTYAGRIERFYSDTQTVNCVVNGNKEDIALKKLNRYIEYRWIYLIDRTSAPFPVKIYVNNITLPYQSSLVPGAIVALSHCQTKTSPYSGKYTSTSSFSQLYMEGGIEKYFMLHPTSYREKTGELMARQNYIHVMSRPDIQLALGGTHSWKIVEPAAFLKYYEENKHKLLWCIPDDKPMARRESKRLFFDGEILRVLTVKDEHRPTPYYTHPTKYKREWLIKCHQPDMYKVHENFYSFPTQKNSSWYAFQRKLPAFKKSVLEEPKCRDIVKRITTQYKKLCGPLMMPAQMPGYREQGPVPPLADLEKLDGAPYLMIDIINQKMKAWYMVIWKSRQFTEAEMMEKVDLAKGKKVVCVAEVFCTETDAPLEVNLLDFVITNDEFIDVDV